jgi:hypothetical protein
MATSVSRAIKDSRLATQSENPESRDRRLIQAQNAFTNLPNDIRNLLVTAASRSGIVYNALNEGRWNSAVRGLRGLGLRYDDVDYDALASQLEAKIPNGLDFY